MLRIYPAIVAEAVLWLLHLVVAKPCTRTAGAAVKMPLAAVAALNSMINTTTNNRKDIKMRCSNLIKEQVEHLTASYDIKNGVIRSPGKFEGEMYYSLYFYTNYLEGGSDHDYLDNGTLISRFNLTVSEKEAFPELSDYDMFEFYESDNGFITGAAG